MSREDRLLIPIDAELLSKLLRIIFEKLPHTYLKAYKVSRSDQIDFKISDRFRKRF